MLRECFSLKINEAGGIYIDKKSTSLLLLLLYLKCVEMWTCQRLPKDFTVYGPLEDEYERYLMLSKVEVEMSCFLRVQARVTTWSCSDTSNSAPRSKGWAMTDDKQDHYSGRTAHFPPRIASTPPKTALWRDSFMHTGCWERDANSTNTGLIIPVLCGEWLLIGVLLPVSQHAINMSRCRRPRPTGHFVMSKCSDSFQHTQRHTRTATHVRVHTKSCLLSEPGSSTAEAFYTRQNMISPGNTFSISCFWRETK